MNTKEVDEWGLAEEDAAHIKAEISRYEKLLAEANAIAGAGGIERLLKMPLLYGIAAVLIFFGVILWGTRTAVLSGMLCVLTGLPVLAVAAILFMKFKKTQPLYREAEKIRTEIEKTEEKAKYANTSYDETE